MKKYIVIFIALAFSVIANAQNELQMIGNTIPAVQDTFFGIKLGSGQTEESINAAVGNKGTFFSDHVVSFGKLITYKDIDFAGKKWDYCDFHLTGKGQFYKLNFYISLSDNNLEDSESADESYESFRSKLASKYGERREITDENEKQVFYVGSNGICLRLSSMRIQSNGGQYRRYVTLNYFDRKINDNLDTQNLDEL